MAKIKHNLIISDAEFKISDLFHSGVRKLWDVGMWYSGPDFRVSEFSEHQTRVGLIREQFHDAGG